MRTIFKKIWELAYPYQDIRDDQGHARTVTNMAYKLLDKETADEDVVIPAAILHDVGWSQVAKEKWQKIIKGLTKKEEKELRREHELKGVKLAKFFLQTVNYPKDKIKEILQIISKHDTREIFISKNEGIVRDADKLWRFLPKAFYLDARRYNMTLFERYSKLKKDISRPGFFYSKSAREIARKELEERKKEI